MSALWDERYERYGATHRSAMFKGLPELVNQYLHAWQVQELMNAIPKRQGQTLLDLGCGYGRLASALESQNPLLKICGLDYSLRALELLKPSSKAQAVQGSLKNLPFSSTTFDCIYCVTALMYLAPADQFAAVQEMVRVLDGDGVGVLIENEVRGVNQLRWLGQLRNRSEQSVQGTNTIEQTFSRQQIHTMFNQAGAQIIREAGCPIFTLALPLLIVLCLLNESLARAALAICQRLDSLFTHRMWKSLYVSYQFRRIEK